MEFGFGAARRLDQGHFRIAASDRLLQGTEFTAAVPLSRGRPAGSANRRRAPAARLRTRYAPASLHDIWSGINPRISSGVAFPGDERP